ncbi:SusC/RagA family TonB-linked outer membrane protein [Neptunitalea chrysea]|uniref:SusC/RagA family TonB-linked outer membrane protein n=1 Tax=Neptunitalea chrysea TaxID=1647581 RepID=A0A9W6EWH6_9FLAO|nr:SusC/RagA family TonB-linked outer membrane protein [Neptunitalea chrysea]
MHAKGQEELEQTKISINLTDATLVQIFSKIKEATNATFSYGEFVLKNKTTYNAVYNNSSVQYILSDLSKKAKFNFVITGSQVVITGRTTSQTNYRNKVGQRLVVTGNVTDADGVPMPGVAVQEKNTTNGISTGFDGEYSITVANENAVLIFSYMGYTTQEIVVGNQVTVNVVLTEEAGALEEVVVVGYGTEKKANLTGAVTSIDGDEIQRNIGPNTSQLLQGISPNLNVTLDNGGINEKANIAIRGMGSINGSSPLVLIDGVQGDINRINPRDIASVSVLKDASSAAIYGARASFGVVLVTTKKAEAGKLQVSYNANFGWSSPTIRTDNFITDGLEWAKLSDKLSLLENSNTYLGYTDEDYAYLEARKADPSLPNVLIKTVDGVERYIHYGNTDWWNTLFSDAQASQEHNISLTGGTDVISVYLSGRFYTREGIYKVSENGIDTYTIRNRIEAQPLSWLKISNATNVYKSDYTEPATNTRNVSGSSNSENWRKYTYHAAPLFLPHNPDGSIMINSAYTSNRDIADGTFADLLYGKSRDNETDFEVFNTTSFVLTPIKGLEIKGDYSFRRRQQQEQVRIISTPHTNQPNGEGVSYYKESTQLYKELERNYLYQAVNAYADYTTKLFKNHQFTALVGYNQEWRWFKRNIASRNGNLSESLNSFNLATGDNITLTSTEEEWALRAGFYRLKYSIADKYLVEFNGRYDLSSRFPEDNRAGFFPSASAAWRVSQENFFTPLKPYVSSLKLRASYGALGNQNVGAYDYYSTMSVEQSSYVVEDALSQYLSSPAPVSSNYSWETSQTLDLGVDVSFLNNRLTVNYDWFQRDVKDMLTEGKQLPSVFGADEPVENAADLRTKGFELSVNWRDEFQLGKKKFKYHIGVNLGDSRTFITKFDNPNGDIQQYYVGQEIGEVWGYTVEGFFQSDDEYLSHADQVLVNERIENNYLINHPVAGDIKFKDVNGDGVISPGDLTLENHGDLKKIGNTSPRYNYGINVGGEYAGFDFNVFAQGIMNRDWNPGTDNGYFWGPFSRQYLNFYSKSIEGMAWTPDNPDAYFPRLAVYAERGGPYEGAQLGVNSDKYLQNAAYLRIKNITVGYTVPESITSKLKIDNIRFYVTGMNLFTFSPIYKHNPDHTVDPEQLGNGNDYPFSKTYSFGLDIKF